MSGKYYLVTLITCDLRKSQLEMDNHKLCPSNISTERKKTDPRHKILITRTHTLGSTVESLLFDYLLSIYLHCQKPFSK